MADETYSPFDPNSPENLAHAAAAEQNRLDAMAEAERARIAEMREPVDPFKSFEPAAAAQRAEETAPVTAKTRLRAFEDETFGEGAGRINGHVERGVGSPYARMTDAQKRQYAALEHMVAAEQKVADASAELAKAEAAHAAAVKGVEASDPSKFGG